MPVGTLVPLRLDRPATVPPTFSQLTAGRRVAERCVKATKADTAAARAAPASSFAARRCERQQRAPTRSSLRGRVVGLHAAAGRGTACASPRPRRRQNLCRSHRSSSRDRAVIAVVKVASVGMFAIVAGTGRRLPRRRSCSS